MNLGQVEHTIASPPVRCIQADELAAYQSLIHSGLTALIYGVFRVEGKPRRLSISGQFDCDDFDLIFKSKYSIHFAQRSSIFAEVQSLVERVQIGILCSDTPLASSSISTWISAPCRADDKERRASFQICFQMERGYRRGGRCFGGFQTVGYH